MLIKYFTFPFFGSKASKSGVYFTCTAQSQLGQAKFQEALRHMWLLTTVVNSAGLETINPDSQDDLLSRGPQAPRR